MYGKGARIMRVGILGHLATGKDIFDGQTVKTREIVNEIQNKKIPLDIYDTYYIKRNKKTLLFNLYRLFKNNEIVIICLSWNGYNKVLPLIAFFQWIFKRRLFDFVIGGKRQDKLKENGFTCRLQNMFEKIYVELPKIVKEYNNLGIYNAEYMPNFKNLKIVEKINVSNGDILRLCTCSRICKEKGIEEAIKATIQANERNNKVICELTIYGTPDKGSEEWFENLMRKSPNYVKYGNIIPSSNTVEYLSKMDILLFPTYHGNEGFPGTIIDAYASGIAVIATDWNFNSELVTDKENGFIVPIKNVAQLSDKIQILYENRKLLHYMKNNSLQKAEKYLTHNVLRSFMDRVKDNA